MSQIRSNFSQVRLRNTLPPLTADSRSQLVATGPYLPAGLKAHPVVVGGGADIKAFLRDAPIKGIQEAAVASHVYPAPVEKTTSPTAIQWIVLSLSNREPRMLRVRENGYKGASWTGDIIKSAYREFADVKFPDDLWYHLWQVDEVES